MRVASGEAPWLAPFLLILAAPLLALGRERRNHLRTGALIGAGALGILWFLL